MNKHIKAGKRLSTVLLIVAYFTILPIHLGAFGAEQEIAWFVNTAQVRGAAGLFILSWILFNIIGAGVFAFSNILREWCYE